VSPRPKPLQYTQHTKAWPTLELHELWVVDELIVDVDDAPSMMFQWVKLPGEQDAFLKVSAYADGFVTLLDPRVLRVLAVLRRKRERNRHVTPAALIAMLQAEGATPSSYHTQHEATV
jgi:hypothetical protein